MQLSFQHISWKLVSRNSTATTVSMHGIVSLLKPRRALRRGYTPPKRWSRHVKITCGLHHMRLKHLRYPPGHIHAIIRRLALSGPVNYPGLPGHHGPKAKTYQNLTVLTVWTLISSGGSCIAWVFFLEENMKTSRWIFFKSNTRSNSANPRWTMHHVKPPWEERA